MLHDLLLRFAIAKASITASDSDSEYEINSAVSLQRNSFSEMKPYHHGSCSKIRPVADIARSARRNSCLQVLVPHERNAF